MFHFIVVFVLDLVNEVAVPNPLFEDCSEFGPSVKDLASIPPQAVEMDAHDYVVALRAELALRELALKYDEFEANFEPTEDEIEAALDARFDFGAVDMCSDAHLDAQFDAFESALGLGVEDKAVAEDGLVELVREAHALTDESDSDVLCDCGYEAVATFVTVDDRLICDECRSELTE